MAKFTVVCCDEMQALYVDHALVLEGHHPPVWQVLRAIYDNHAMTEIGFIEAPARCLSSNGSFPSRFEDLKIQ